MIDGAYALLWRRALSLAVNQFVIDAALWRITKSPAVHESRVRPPSSLLFRKRPPGTVVYPDTYRSIDGGIDGSVDVGIDVDIYGDTSVSFYVSLNAEIFMDINTFPGIYIHSSRFVLTTALIEASLAEA